MTLVLADRKRTQLVWMLALLLEEHFRRSHNIFVGTRLAAFRQLAAVGGKFVEVHERRSVLVEIVSLQPSHHDEDLLWFHFKELLAGSAIKIDHFFRRSFGQ
jgi:hypothetical protein